MLSDTLELAWQYLPEKFEDRPERINKSTDNVKFASIYKSTWCLIYNFVQVW